MDEKEIAVGDIFVCQWGYIDKIVGFYKIIKKTKKTVVIKKLKGKVVKRLPGRYEVLLVPTNEFDEKADKPEMRKKIQDDGSLMIKSYAWAYKWDGKPVTAICGLY